MTAGNSFQVVICGNTWRNTFSLLLSILSCSEDGVERDNHPLLMDKSTCVFGRKLWEGDAFSQRAGVTVKGSEQVPRFSREEQKRDRLLQVLPTTSNDDLNSSLLPFRWQGMNARESLGSGRWGECLTWHDSWPTNHWFYKVFAVD
jgi:hypothetical protein